MEHAIQHVIHDIDRDGWGSAALLVAELGPARCVLHPTAGKDGLAEIAKLDAQPGDHVWVLDIPTPECWVAVPSLPGVAITWVDHHPVRANDKPQDFVRVCLPRNDDPTTTMHLLIDHDLIPSLPAPRRFVEAMCGPGSASSWAGAFDGLEAEWKRAPFSLDGLADLISQAPLCGPVPAELRHYEQHALSQRAAVDAVLDKAKVDLTTRVVVVRLPNGFRQPVKLFSLRAQERWHRPVSIIVHHGGSLYCGRRSRGGPKIDFLAHFKSRGFNATGHPYVAFVDVPEHRVEDEIGRLLAEVEGA